MPVTPLFERLRLEDYKSKASLHHIRRLFSKFKD
jgi:hypothetical protein